MADKSKTAGLFDIRSVIGLLLGCYGIILTLVGLFANKELDKTGGINANLVAGVSLLVAGGTFLLWAKLRPIRVPEEHQQAVEGAAGH